MRGTLPVLITKPTVLSYFCEYLFNLKIKDEKNKLLLSCEKSNLLLYDVYYLVTVDLL